MRWEYTAPEKKLFVSDGVKIYSYMPADKQVIVSDVPAERQRDDAGAVSGRQGQPDPRFHAVARRPARRRRPGSRALKLVPKTPQPDYDWLILVVEPGDARPCGAWCTVDAQGGTSTFFFTNLKENVGLADKEFEFRTPRGVDVVTGSSVR